MTKIKRMINGALMDEKGAKLYYSRLIHQTSNKEEKKRIEKIRDDEMRHFRILSRMKKKRI